jgi:hypothetical protein
MHRNSNSFKIQIITHELTNKCLIRSSPRFCVVGPFYHHAPGSRLPCLVEEHTLVIVITNQFTQHSQRPSCKCRRFPPGWKHWIEVYAVRAVTVQMIYGIRNDDLQIFRVTLVLLESMYSVHKQSTDHDGSFQRNYIISHQPHKERVLAPARGGIYDRPGRPAQCTGHGASFGYGQALIGSPESYQVYRQRLVLRVMAFRQDQAPFRHCQCPALPATRTGAVRYAEFNNEALDARTGDAIVVKVNYVRVSTDGN